MSVPFWIDLQRWRLFLTVLTLFSIRHRFVCGIQVRGWRGEVDVGGASRGQASACSTDTHVSHEDGQRQDIHPSPAISGSQHVP